MTINSSLTSWSFADRMSDRFWFWCATKEIACVSPIASSSSTELTTILCSLCTAHVICGMKQLEGDRMHRTVVHLRTYFAASGNSTKIKLFTALQTPSIDSAVIALQALCVAAKHTEALALWRISGAEKKSRKCCVLSALSFQ